MSAGESPLRQAIRWLDEQLTERSPTDRAALVDETARRFDLSPLDADFLYRHLASRGPRA